MIESSTAHLQAPQIRFEDDKKRSEDTDKDKDEMRGFLHCAPHDETVRGSGRNDDDCKWS
jgi:hypothetical protein